MNLATLIAKRAEEGRPIRVGMIGAGKFGTMLEETTFVNGEGEEVQRRFVFTESLDILLEFIIQGRDLDSDKVKVNVEQDSGQQRMLVVLQIGDEIEKTVKDTSTKRGIIIAFVDDIPENYRNLSIIHNKLKIHLIPHHYKIVSDLKLYSHFGRNDLKLPWENVDEKANKLKEDSKRFL